MKIATATTAIGLAIAIIASLVPDDPLAKLWLSIYAGIAVLVLTPLVILAFALRSVRRSSRRVSSRER